MARTCRKLSLASAKCLYSPSSLLRPGTGSVDVEPFCTTQNQALLRHSPFAGVVDLCFLAWVICGCQIRGTSLARRHRPSPRRPRRAEPRETLGPGFARGD